MYLPVFSYQTLPHFSVTMTRLTKIEEMIMKTPGVHAVTAVLGFSMLSGAQNTYSSFYWITLKEWGERKAPEEQYEAIKRHLNQELSRSRKGWRFPFPHRQYRAWELPEVSPSCWRIARAKIHSS